MNIFFVIFAAIQLLAVVAGLRELRREGLPRGSAQLDTGRMGAPIYLLIVLTIVFTAITMADTAVLMEEAGTIESTPSPATALRDAGVH